MKMAHSVLTPSYQELLLRLLEIDTVSPMETGTLSDLSKANMEFTQAAVALGFEVVTEVIGQDSNKLPASVRRKVQEVGAPFFPNQPSMVLGLGDWRNRERTIMFNFHMDTVGPVLPVKQTTDRIEGRGVVDNKGPGVAVLAAIDRWLAKNDKPQRIGILIQVVGGEEGGAMGTYGTRMLFDQSYYGALNVFVIPSEGQYFDSSTSSMTVEINVDGNSATDDSPSAAVNATLLLSAMATSISKTLAPELEKHQVKMTVAGLHTGSMHNRVYGQGKLLMNFSYRLQKDGQLTEQAFGSAYDQAVTKFVSDFSGIPLFKRTIDQLSTSLTYRWLKKGLPVLDNRDHRLESLLNRAGINRHKHNERTFTCDAMWGQQHDAYSIMYGPGSLEENGAHTADEFISIHELESFSQSIVQLLAQFNHEFTLPERTRVQAKIPTA
ncbi:M20/M25/M40 family metallo-hydrolase [Reinekea forsetii]|jgi:acetylornithine deacetylase|uniref:Peptidase, M20 family n=1 Tax=Reinekea forsetii TaxID=1336806 RepID=A0A2K8KUR3_9GAMM|nr:M20/M25/M40 family metallo-hydrolase [Reinekea forsetii]ATX77054.1 peptidase, M20 family [Reinekea forsetii]